jgi:hypothetical protein
MTQDYWIQQNAQMINTTNRGHLILFGTYLIARIIGIYCVVRTYVRIYFEGDGDKQAFYSL